MLLIYTFADDMLYLEKLDTHRQLFKYMRKILVAIG